MYKLSKVGGLWHCYTHIINGSFSSQPCLMTPEGTPSQPAYDVRTSPGDVIRSAEAEPADVGRWWWIRPVLTREFLLVPSVGTVGTRVNLGYLAGEVATLGR